MPPKRSYGDGCATAHALDLIGERWALLVVRELLLGPKRFNDIRAGLRGISPAVLAERLRQLSDSGVVQHRQLPPPNAVPVYELTPWGRDLEPAIYALGQWAVRSPAMPITAPLSNDTHILSLGVLFDAEAARGRTVRITFRLGEHRYHMCVLDGTLTLGRGTADQADAIVDTDFGTLAALLRRTRSFTDIVEGGDLRVHGDPTAVTLLLKLFSHPGRRNATL